jgi:magnesium transporter
MQVNSKKSTKTGLAPGSFVYIGDEHAVKTHVNLIGYSPTTFDYIDTDASIEKCVETKDQFNVVWINIIGLSDLDKIAKIAAAFGANKFTIEDIFNTEQRSKIDIFNDYIFFITKLYFYNEVHKKFSIQQVGVICGKNFVITIQEKETPVFDLVVERIKNPQGIFRAKSADHLAYAILDVTVDSYFRIIEELGEQVEALEEKLLQKPDPVLINEINGLKREVIYLRRAVWPLREIVNKLQLKISNIIHDETLPYLRDVYDHVIQVIDDVEIYRDLLAGMLDLYMSSVSNRMNEVMKVLTVFASIFIPLTFLTGLYGMNFNPTISVFNMPELDWKYGYFYALGLMLSVVIAMLIYFKRKKWW